MTRGGTSWRRFVVLGIPALVGVAVLAGMLLFGVLPLGLYVVGHDVQIASATDRGNAPQGLTAYVDVQQMKNGGSREPVAMAYVPQATLPDGLCLSLALTFPLIGTNTLRLDFTGHTVAREVTVAAADFRAGATRLTAASTDGADVRPDRSNLDRPVRLGLDAAELGGAAGGFGADIPGSTDIAQLAASAKKTVIAGTFRMSGIRLPRIGHGAGVEHGACYQPGAR
ncbi:DUF6230 domain-containing protein [Skermania piniformis]